MWAGKGRMQPTPPAGRPPAGLGAQQKASSGFTVTSMSKKDDIGIDVLLGDYAEKGSNHNRTYYQKVQAIPGHEDIKVFLYYWDSRDGADFSGWWFGNELGGSQVWAKVNAHGPTPPKAGWRVPWDAPTVEPGILVVSPTSQAAPAATLPGGKSLAAATQPAAGAASAQVVLAKARETAERFKAMEASLNETLRAAKTKLIPGKATPDSAQEAQDALQASLGELLEMQKQVAADVTEARKGGPSANIAVSQLSQLAPRIRTLQAAATVELNKAKATLAKAEQEGQKSMAAQQAQAASEERDARELEGSLPEATTQVTAAEDGVEAVTILTQALVNDPPESLDSPACKLQLSEVESAYTDAQTKVTEARSVINTKLQGARKFAPEARKTALAQFSALQSRLSEVQKKLAPFKTFKQDFQARITAKRAVTEVAEKLGIAELEAERAEIMSAPAEQGQLDEAELKEVEAIMAPAAQNFNSILRNVETKLRAATGPMKEELTALKDRIGESKKKLDMVADRLKKQKDSWASQKMLIVAMEKVDKAEETLRKCQDAEMPFLSGIEVLPKKESEAAIRACEIAAKESETIIAAARTFIHAKTAEVSKLPQDSAKGIAEELAQLKERVDKAAQKLANFKKETGDRKTSSVLSEVVEAVSTAEVKVAALKELVAPLESADLADTAVEELKAAGEKATEAEKEATKSCNDARKVHTEKLKVTTRGGDCFAELTKLQSRLTSAQGEIAKYKKIALTSSKLVVSKGLMAEEDKNISKIEADLEKASDMVKGAANGKLTAAMIKEIDETAAASDKVLKAFFRNLETQLPGAPAAAKAALQQLVERGKKATKAATTVKASIKDQREKVLVASYAEEGLKLVAELQDELSKMNQTELPFLKGLEVLPLQEATDTLEKSDACIKVLQEMINKSRTFIAAKNLELRRYDKDVAEPTIEAFSKASDEINKASQQLSQFKKDTESRKTGVQLQEAGSKVEHIEEMAKEIAEAVKVAEEKKKDEKNPDDPSPEFSELLLALMAKEKTASDALKTTRVFLLTAQRAAKDNGSQKEALSNMQPRLSAASVQISKATKVTSAYEKSLAAKKLVAEVKELIEEAEETVKKATEKCAPLVEDGAPEYLVYTSINMLADALDAHMEAKDLSEDAVFQAAGKGVAMMSRARFAEYLGGVASAIDREELKFTEERAAAMFDKMDTNGDEAVDAEEFKAMFRRRYTCVKMVTLTDAFDVDKCKPLQKIKPGEELSTVGRTKKNGKGMLRAEVKLKDSDVSGWVTISNEKAPPFCERHAVFNDYAKELEKYVEESRTSVTKASAFIKTKLSSAGGTMTQARGELTKLQPQAQACVGSMDKLRRAVETAKKDFAKREQDERNAHILAKERAAAEEVLSKVRGLVEAMQEAVSELKAAAEPLTKLPISEAESFAEPATVEERCERMGVAASEKITSSRSALREQQKRAAVAGTTTSAMIDAKRAMARMSATVEQSEAALKATREGVRKACKAIVQSRSKQAAAAVRKQVIAQNITAEELFVELAKSKDRISEDAFCTYLSTLDGLDFKPEHARLVCRSIEVGGIGRRKFLDYIQQYFCVKKEIAVTTSLDISTGKTIRRAEMDELLIVTEGPCTDEKLGVSRIKGRMLRDGQEGWVTLKGNQGTPYLQEVEKPYFSTTIQVRLDKESGNVEGQGEVRKLAPDEILELVEGPKKETFPDSIRVRGKAMKDGATGWILAQDKAGVVIAEAEDNYYTCTATVAMTDGREVATCKGVRKLAIGELVLVTEGPESTEGGVTRCKGVTVKDKVEGWITTKGNAGSVYMEKSTKFYSLKQATPLKKSMAGAEVVRQMEAGEAFLVQEGPKAERTPPEHRIRVRALSDAVTGWITLSKKTLRPWSPTYKCVTASLPFHSSRIPDGAAEIRKLSEDETVEWLEGPVKEGEELRIKARSTKDGLAGWLTVRNAKGEALLVTN